MEAAPPGRPEVTMRHPGPVGWLGVGVLAGFGLLGAGCRKEAAEKPEPAWPDRPLERRAATKHGVTFSLLLPRGIGVFEDPNGNIWRDVAPDVAVFVSVFVVEFPKDLAAAREDLLLGEKEKLVEQAVTADGFRLVTEREGFRKFTVIRRGGERGVKCSSFYHLDEADAARVKRWNAWLERLCASLEIGGRP
jgi:hypothetical protein